MTAGPTQGESLPKKVTILVKCGVATSNAGYTRTLIAVREAHTHGPKATIKIAHKWGPCEDRKRANHRDIHPTASCARLTAHV